MKKNAATETWRELIILSENVFLNQLIESIIGTHKWVSEWVSEWIK